MKYRAVLFDLDGTLVDSLGDIELTINETRAFFGLFPMKHEEISPNVGFGLAHLLKMTFADSDLSISQILEKYRILYRKNMLTTTRPYRDIIPLLDILERQKTSLFVVTNKTEEPSRIILEKLGLNRFFINIAGGDTFAARKPDPIQITSLLSAAQISPVDALMAGDHENDILAAHAAGCSSVLCKWGFGTPGEARPDYIAEHPLEILNFL